LPRQDFLCPKVITIPPRFVFGYCRFKGLSTSSVLLSKLLNVSGSGVLTADPSHWLVSCVSDEEVFKMRFYLYEGESNENLKSAIKIRNTARWSCKLTTVLLMV